MALIALLRGVNVGGHRAFRPKLLAQALAPFDVVNIGSVGTFVVLGATSQAQLRAALVEKLPAGSRFVLCDGGAFLRFIATVAWDERSASDGSVSFVSFFERSTRRRVALPLSIPRESDCFVHVSHLSSRFACGEYRRHMKTIGYLGELDARFGTLVTTRSGATVEAIRKVLLEGAGGRA